jgi:hypothetical protein
MPATSTSILITPTATLALAPNSTASFSFISARLILAPNPPLSPLPTTHSSPVMMAPRTPTRSSTSPGPASLLSRLSPVRRPEIPATSHPAQLDSPIRTAAPHSSVHSSSILQARPTVLALPLTHITTRVLRTLPIPSPSKLPTPTRVAPALLPQSLGKLFPRKSA